MPGSRERPDEGNGAGPVAAPAFGGDGRVHRRVRTTDLEMPSAVQPGKDLSILALLMGAGFTLAAFWYDVYPWLTARAVFRKDAEQTLSRLSVEVLFAAFCFAVGWRSRRRAPPPKTAQGLAVLIQLAAALLLSVPLGPRVGAADAAVAHGISWVCVIIVIFPLMIPGRARFHVTIALLSAVMWPLYQALRSAFGWPTPTPSFVLDYSVPPFLCVGIVLAAARIMGRIRQSVQDARSEAAAARQTARELGSYTLRHLLGRGGMGEVWVAEHRMLARPAAIKLIRLAPEGTGPAAPEELLRRFEQEARATARLRSQHTVELYDFGRTEDGSFYYVMELLDGIDLEELVRRHGAQPPARVAHLLAQACLSLHEAHGRGLVHRDIKPSNLFLCRRGSELDVVKVLDFGLVQYGPDVPGRGERLLMGTPAYMPPECFSADRTIDHRSDLYALGCVGYWLLTGRTAFESAPLEMSTHGLSRRPHEPPARHAKDVPPDLEAVIMACLAENPGDRPSSASELRDRLLRCRFRDPWNAEDQQAWWEKIPRPVAGAEETGSERTVMVTYLARPPDGRAV